MEKNGYYIFSAFIHKTIKSKSIFLKKWGDQSQKQILLMSKSKNYQDLKESLKELKAVETNKNSLRFARNRIRKSLKNVLELSSSLDDQADDKTLHKLRISIKKLRYTCEFFQPIFKKYICSLNSIIAKTKKIQDILGDHQDAITGISLLTHLRIHFLQMSFLRLKKDMN